MSAEMNTEPSLTAFVTDPQTPLEKLEPANLSTLLELLTIAEHPDSYRVLFWLLLRTLHNHPELHAAVVEEWKPNEASLARLLEDVGKHGAQIVLSLEGVKSELERIWQLCDDIGVSNLEPTSEPLEVVALAPMAALFTERQLDELVAAVAQGRQWKDPAEVLSPSGETEFDLEAILALAQSRMVKAEGGEALNIVVLRLLSMADKVD